MSETKEPVTSPNLTIGVRLCALRHDYGCEIDVAEISPAEFADILGVSDVAYQMYETGLADPPASVLAAIRDCTGVSLDWLVTGSA